MPAARTVPVGLSTASVYPESAQAGFELAADLGYDGVEVMVWTDPVSQDPEALVALSKRYGVPVLAVHAPCLLISQRIWSPDPKLRLARSTEVAQRLGAGTVVVHPPFRWQQDYSRRFADQVAALEESTGVVLAVENMFPVRRGRITVSAYQPSPDPTEVGHAHYTLDLSHTAASGADALALADRMGAGLSHLHLTDGSGAPRDEHLVPGKGTQPCAEVCRRIAETDTAVTVIVEISTRRARSRADRHAAIAESLLFARLNL